MTLSITPIYAALIAALYLFLSARVITYRRGHRVNLGDEGDSKLLRRVRAHANCAEYAPFALVLLLLIELQGAPSVALHVLGLSLLVGRLMHGIGLSLRRQNFTLRVGGMALTLTMIAVSAAGLLLHALF
jgi:uncharacterized membrane protein YecN with MAPEG domain